ncbi:hypothetical protein AB0M80_20995 [Amycolatopsis sp. NPDC051045]|uniref:hypothetical protein n=1 Tax=Amycolatopsis sp. NPDC051045 TaxID=3156922 RepID=UPI00342A03CC
MGVLARWLTEYWERGHEEVALSQWAVTARYAPEKADRYLVDLKAVLAEADPGKLTEVLADFGIDLDETGDKSYAAWLTRVLEEFTQVLADRRP